MVEILSARGRIPRRVGARGDEGASDEKTDDWGGERRDFTQIAFLRHDPEIAREVAEGTSAW